MHLEGAHVELDTGTVVEVGLQRHVAVWLLPHHMGRQENTTDAPNRGRPISQNHKTQISHTDVHRQQEKSRSTALHNVYACVKI